MRNILVPTDGSSQSEVAVPIALTLARKQGAQIEFARVVEFPQWTGTGPDGYLSSDLYDELMASLDEAARVDLDRLAARAQADGVSALKTLLHGSSPILPLLELEEQSRPGLVIIGTHGRTGLSRFALGSVADCLVREGASPVLLVRSFGEAPQSIEHAVLPLDGSATAEVALTTAEMFAGKPLNRVDLVEAVNNPGEVVDATQYLNSVADRLRAAGLVVELHVRVGNPAEVIEDAAQGADVVIMATHGRGGLERLRHGSVAEQALRGLAVPLLLVRANTPEPMREPDSQVVGVSS